MIINHTSDSNKGLFFVQEGADILARLDYAIPEPGKMIIEHTEVNDVLGGQNVGYLLVKSAVEYARLQHLKILPHCPFAAALFKKKPELADVLLSSTL